MPLNCYYQFTSYESHDTLDSMNKINYTLIYLVTYAIYSFSLISNLKISSKNFLTL